MFSPKFDLKDKAYTVPADINAALSHAILSVVALTNVLARETEALKETKTRAFMELQDEKVEAGRRYEMLVNDLMSRGTMVKKADPKLKAKLQSLQTQFSEIAAENLKWLDRMKNATGKLGETIMREARKSAEKQTQFAYGASGTMQRGTKALIGFDERA